MEKVSVRIWTTDVNPPSDEAALVYARMLEALTDDERTAMATFIDGQVAAGNWQKLDEFCFFGMISAVNARVGWKQTIATAGSSGDAGLTHTPKQGIASSGIGSLNTNFDLQANGNNQSVGDKMLGAYVLQESTPGGSIDGIIGNLGSGHFLKGPTPAGAGQRSYQGSQGGADAEIVYGSNPSVPFALSVNQSGSSCELRADGVVQDTGVGADSILGAIDYDVFRLTDIGDFWDGELAAWWSGQHSGFNYISFQAALTTLIADFAAIP